MTWIGFGGTLKYGLAPSTVCPPNLKPPSSQRMRQVCQASSTIPGIDFPSQVFPLDAAWTVVPGAHSPLPYHSNTSTSPSGCGSSLTVQNEGHRPGNKQLSLIRASQVVPIEPRQLPRNLPLKY